MFISFAYSATEKNHKPVFAMSLHQIDKCGMFGLKEIYRDIKIFDLNM